MKQNYTYGPVPSRRLGFSLGVDLVPFKTCSFDCIYCQCGKTTDKTCTRKEYHPTEDILNEVKRVLRENEHIDYITFSGSGEPTLHSRIGYLIQAIKKVTDIPIAVLTNGSLLHRQDVQDELSYADVVAPTLCTADKQTFSQINRCHVNITVDHIIHGLISFRKRFKGQLWLEIVFVKNCNDSDKELEKLKSVIDQINPDKVHINTVVRPPSETSAQPISSGKMRKIKNVLGEKAEIIARFTRDAQSVGHITEIEQQILNIIKRRPVTLEEIQHITGLHIHEVIKYLDALRADNKIRITEHSGQKYYEPAQ